MEANDNVPFEFNEYDQIMSKIMSTPLLKDKIDELRETYIDAKDAVGGDWRQKMEKIEKSALYEAYKNREVEFFDYTTSNNNYETKSITKGIRPQHQIKILSAGNFVFSKDRFVGSEMPPLKLFAKHVKEGEYFDRINMMLDNCHNNCTQCHDLFQRGLLSNESKFCTASVKMFCGGTKLKVLTSDYVEKYLEGVKTRGVAVVKVTRIVKFSNQFKWSGKCESVILIPDWAFNSNDQIRIADEDVMNVGPSIGVSSGLDAPSGFETPSGFIDDLFGNAETAIPNSVSKRIAEETDDTEVTQKKIKP